MAFMILSKFQENKIDETDRSMWGLNDDKLYKFLSCSYRSLQSCNIYYLQDQNSLKKDSLKGKVSCFYQIIVVQQFLFYTTKII